MNRVFADASNGSFVLRIEDTDQARSSRTSEQAIVKALNWLGLQWDEGPDVGGAHGPYRQSERLDIYQRHAQQLLELGEAFHCFCSSERLEEIRRQQMANKETPRYDGACLKFSRQDAQARLEAGEQSVIRLKVPADGVCSFQDHLRGQIQIPWTQVDMQILIKSDGYPTYHLAACVDDELMQISHLIRGEEWINSVPKQQLLTRAFGWRTPTYVHLPLIRNPDGSKLSKRRNPTSIDYYRRIGILPEALLNYLGTLGWSMRDESEIFSLIEMCAHFDLSRLKTSAPVFDQVKLKSFNGKYLRDLDSETLLARYVNWANDSGAALEIAELVRERTEAFADIAPQINYLIGDRPSLNAENFEHKALSDAQQLEILAIVNWSLEGVTNWRRDDIYAACKQMSDAMQFKFKDFLSPLFLAISGRKVSLPLFDSMAVLGKDVSLVRIREAMECLGGLSKKRQKSLRKEFDALG